MRLCRLRPVRDEEAFTLVEIVLVVGVIFVTVGSAMTLLDVGFRTQRGQQARSETLDEARGAMHRMTKELRQALSVDMVSTRDRLDMMTLVNGVERHVVYDVDGSTLRRALDSQAPVTVAGGLNADDVFCFDPPSCASAGPATDHPSIVRVSLSLVPASRGAEPIRLSTDVQLRNSIAS